MSLTDAYYNSSLSLGNRGYISPFSIFPHLQSPQFQVSSARSAQYAAGSCLAISSISLTRPSAASPAFVRYLSKVSAPALLRIWCGVAAPESTMG